MVDNVKLRSIIYCSKMNIKSFARDIGIAENTAHAKLRNQVAWTSTEMQKIRMILSLSDQDIIDIFFANDV